LAGAIIFKELEKQESMIVSGDQDAMWEISLNIVYPVAAPQLATIIPYQSSIESK